MIIPWVVRMRVPVRCRFPRPPSHSAEHWVWRHGPATGAPDGPGGAVKVEKCIFATAWVRFRFVFRSFGSVFASFFVRLGRVRFVFRSLGSVFGSAWFGLVWFGSVRLKPIRFDIVRFDSIRFGSDRQQWNCYLIRATGGMSIDR